MSSLQVHTERSEVARLEAIFEQEPKCEHREHMADAECHSGAATHFQKAPCGHGDGLRCARWVAWVSSNPVWATRCPECGLDAAELRFVEL